MPDVDPITTKPELLRGERAAEIDRLIGEVRGLALIIERLHYWHDVAMDTAIRELVGRTGTLCERWDEVY
jgi:hypothetical protein